MLVLQHEVFFNTAHKILRHWLRMLCLRASEHVWIDISRVMTSQNEFIYTGFPQYDYFILLIFLVEFYIILPSTFILPSSTHIYNIDLWWQKSFDQNLMSHFRKQNMTSALNTTAFKYIHSIIHLVVCLTIGPMHLPKRALHIVRSRVSSFKWQYPLLSLSSTSSFLRLLPRLPFTSIPHFIFPSITRYVKQVLRKIWPIQLAFLLFISCRTLLCSLTVRNTSSFHTWSVQLILSILL
jgi:hypothetical protein